MQAPIFRNWVNKTYWQIIRAANRIHITCILKERGKGIGFLTVQNRNTGAKIIFNLIIVYIKKKCHPPCNGTRSLIPTVRGVRPRTLAIELHSVLLGWRIFLLSFKLTGSLWRRHQPTISDINFHSYYILKPGQPSFAQGFLCEIAFFQEKNLYGHSYKENLI